MTETKRAKESWDRVRRATGKTIPMNKILTQAVADNPYPIGSLKFYEYAIDACTKLIRPNAHSERTAGWLTRGSRKE